MPQAASAIYCVRLVQTNPSAAFFLMPARFWEIGLGCISYLVVSSGAVGSALYRRQPVVLLLALCGALFAPAWLYLPAVFFIVAATAILIATPAPESVAYKILTLRPVVFIGKISYSLYLWHWGVLSVSRWFIGDSVWSVSVQLICILLLSLLSYYCVESPLRRFQWSKHPWKGIAAGAYACIFAALFLEILAVPLRPQLTAAANE
jgi:peptidoglycan/LPS O-acetylase OafA/YrhL